ncbi:glucose-6-phosphate dehydrogenase assembly protein OpcA [Propionicimonas sp.]|uniref:glucose-6-phosphate dehydrogenase assembly protein OpcA n=1 Tax=Propionicimonas sp. TaxID=1955623 RepID=UPI0039E3702A
MIVKLTNTNAAEVQQGIQRARHNIGAASGLVFTLVVIAEMVEYDKAMEACIEAGREHPSRILLVTNGRARADRLDAEVQAGEGSPGEIISLKFHGELQKHRESVVLPLLLPDLPVIGWWPGRSPKSPGTDPLGRLATRRITDAMGDPNPLAALEVRARNYCPGDTDLTWTRLTRWRGLLAAALDAYPMDVSRVTVSAAPDNAAGTLLAAWLSQRLDVPVAVDHGRPGIGITGVVLTAGEDQISVTRTDGNLASFSAPGLPRRLVAVPRRDLNTLLAEELRRLDDDAIYAEAMAALVRRLDRAAERNRGRTA